jgi:hypothetical protein
MRSFIYPLLFLLITSCVTTKTIYKSETNCPMKRLGITNLNKQHPVINQMFPTLNKLFNNEIQQVLSTANYQVIITNDSLQFDTPDLDKVKTICNNKNLDGLVISKITFTHISNFVYFIPTSEYYDNILELKLIDKEGVIRLIIKHNTGNDIYMSVPENEVSIKTSIDKATKQLIKEFHF